MDNITENFNEDPNISQDIYPPKPKTIKKLIIKIIAIIIGIIVISGGVVLASRIWDPLWNPFRPNPGEVIERMYKNMDETKSFHSEMVIEIKNLLSGSQNYIIKINDDTDKENKKSKGRIDLVLEDDLFSFSFGVEYIVADDQIFFKLGNIPPFAGMDFSVFSGQWIVAEDSSDTNQEINFIDNLKKILVFSEELKDEKINDKANYHYVLKLNEDKLEELNQTLVKRISSSIPLIGDGGEDISLASETFKNFEIDYFIDKKSELLSKASSYHKELEREGTKISLNFEWLFSAFDEQINIETPLDAKSLEKVFEELFLQRAMDYSSFPDPSNPYDSLEMNDIRKSIESFTPLLRR